MVQGLFFFSGTLFPNSCGYRQQALISFLPIYRLFIIGKRTCGKKHKMHNNFQAGGSCDVFRCIIYTAWYFMLRCRANAPLIPNLCRVECLCWVCQVPSSRPLIDLSSVPGSRSIAGSLHPLINTKFNIYSDHLPTRKCEYLQFPCPSSVLSSPISHISIIVRYRSH